MNKWETKSYKSNVSKAACDAKDGAYFFCQHPNLRQCKVPVYSSRSRTLGIDVAASVF